MQDMFNPFNEFRMLTKDLKRDTETKVHVEPCPELLEIFTDKADELEHDPLKINLDDISMFFEAKVLPANVMGHHDELYAYALNGRNMVLPFLCELWFFICDNLQIARVVPSFKRVEIYRANEDFIIAIEMPDSDRPAAAKYIAICISGKGQTTGYFTYEPNDGKPQISEYRGEILYGTGEIAACEKLNDFVSLLIWQFSDPDFKKN